MAKKERVNPYKAAEEARKKKEAEEAAKKAAQEAQGAPEGEGAVTTPAEPETKQEPPFVAEAEPVTETEVEVAAEETVVEEQTAEPRKNLLDSLVIEKKKPSRATYGFYLDDDVHEAIVKAAKKNKVSKSEIANRLLRQAIFGE